MGNGSLFPDVPFSFGPKFLHDHAGHIITDPLIALVELIANAYDAGASLVDIRWPATLGESFQVIDNGTGMTAEEMNYPAAELRGIRGEKHRLSRAKILPRSRAPRNVLIQPEMEDTLL